ncbi:MAG: N-acetyltransferase [Pseudomonadales bacterium]|nr:N-acetyltransferase [Pseudomonadales bacterium]
MDIKILHKISHVSSQQWNCLVKNNNPFLKYEFLDALENQSCVGRKSGWIPCHVVIFEDQQLKAAMPLYKKYNSNGEFVFDYAWADAYAKNGLAYYPKLVSAIPYTPAIGQRLLCRKNDEPKYMPLLLKVCLDYAKEINASSFHCLFPDKPSHAAFEKNGLINRYDCQFYWHNRDYLSFDNFLSELTSRKRKNIKKERCKIINLGITFRILNGHTATETDWRQFFRFYEKTHLEKRNMPKFNFGFFTEIAKTIPDQIVLVMTDQGQDCIAAALMYRSETHLYGRHWGASKQIDGLHFEACYYQGIEYCIRENLQCFEPGVQGEHKIPRGFVPTRTVSNHWISDPRFASAIKNYCKQEKEGVDEYIKGLQTSIPYRKTEGE